MNSDKLNLSLLVLASKLVYSFSFGKYHFLFLFTGQYSCFFVYLRLVMNFSKEAVAMFIAAIGILSVIAQTGFLTLLMKTLGSKHTIMVGLLFEMLQLMWYGFGSQTWMMWAAGLLASISRYSNITYPTVSSVSVIETECEANSVSSLV
jgi:hypothetical protein